MLSFYILFLIPLFLIHSHKLFSMQLGPSTVSLACARLIVSFAPFTTEQREKLIEDLLVLKDVVPIEESCSPEEEEDFA